MNSRDKEYRQKLQRKKKLEDELKKCKLEESSSFSGFNGVFFVQCLNEKDIEVQAATYRKITAILKNGDASMNMQEANLIWFQDGVFVKRAMELLMHKPADLMQDPRVEMLHSELVHFLIEVDGKGPVDLNEILTTCVKVFVEPHYSQRTKSNMLFYFANIAAGDDKLRKQVEQISMVPCIEFIQTCVVGDDVSLIPVTILQAILYFSRVMCRGDASSTQVETLVNLVIRFFLHTTNVDVMQECCEVFTNIVIDSSDFIATLCKTGVLTKLATLFSSNIAIGAVLPVLSNIVSNPMDHAPTVLELPKLPASLRTHSCHADPDVRQKCCFLISNLAAGEPAAKQVLFDAGIMEVMIAKATGDVNMDVRHEALFALRNLCSKTPERCLPLLLQKNIVSVFVAQLKAKKDISNALNGLNGLLFNQDMKIVDRGFLLHEFTAHGGQEAVATLLSTTKSSEIKESAALLLKFLKPLEELFETSAHA